MNLLSILTVWTVCAAAPNTPGVSNAPPALLESIDAFYAAVEEGDVPARIALLADDMLMMPNHWTHLEGREPVATMLESAADAVFRIRDREVLRLEVSGDLAVLVNSYLYTYHAEGDQEQWHRTKNVHVWRRNAHGEWKISLDIWNSDVPVARFDQE